MTNIQNLIVASKNGCFVKFGIQTSTSSFSVMPNFDSAFEFLKKKLLKGKLQQWISIKYCALCLDHEAAAPETKTTKENFSFYLYYVTSYLASYLTSKPKPKTKTHQNSFTKPSFFPKNFVLCVGGGGSG